MRFRGVFPGAFGIFWADRNKSRKGVVLAVWTERTVFPFYPICDQIATLSVFFFTGHRIGLDMKIVYDGALWFFGPFFGFSTFLQLDDRLDPFGIGFVPDLFRRDVRDQFSRVFPASIGGTLRSVVDSAKIGADHKEL